MAPDSGPRGLDGEPAGPWGVGPGGGCGSTSSQEPSGPGDPQRGGEAWRSFPERNRVPPRGAQSEQSGVKGLLRALEGACDRRTPRPAGWTGPAGRRRTWGHRSGSQGARPVRERGARRQHPDAPRKSPSHRSPRPRGLAHTASPLPPGSTNQKPGTHGETPHAQARHTLRASHTHPIHQGPTAMGRASLHRGPGSPERHAQQLASQSPGPGCTPLGPCSVPFQPMGGSPSLMAGSGAAALRRAEGVGKTNQSRAEAPEVGPSLVTSRSPA